MFFDLKNALPTDEFLNLMKSRVFTVTEALRLAVGRDSKGALVWKASTSSGPKADGFKEVDQSIHGIVGDREFVLVQSQAIFDQLELTTREVCEVGRVLVAVHKTGHHMATLGMQMPGRVVNVDVLICTTNDSATWERYDATTASGVTGLQLLDGDDVGVRTVHAHGSRIVSMLGTVPLDVLIDDVTAGKTITFKEGAALQLPRGALLPPRMVNKFGGLTLAYTVAGKTYVAASDTDGNYMAVPYVHKDDIVGQAVPFAVMEDSVVTGECGLFRLDSTLTGVGRVTRGLTFEDAFRM